VAVVAAVAAVMAAAVGATAVAAEATAVVAAADTVADVAMAAETSGAAVNQQRLARSICSGGTGCSVPSKSFLVVIRSMG
jgi:hypothetical protein